MPPAATLVVMARWPAAGRCKRRLARDLSQVLQHPGAAERAALIQRQLTGHTLTVAKQLDQEGWLDVVLAVSGAGPSAARRWGRGLGVSCVRLQGSGGLGTRLRRQLLLSRRNDGPTLVIGTDLPWLNRHDLLAAIAMLQRCDLVLGPAVDGGYWLIGFSSELLRRPAHWPLSGIPWGGDQVLASTLRQATDRGVSTLMLGERNDLDQLADLRPWLD